MLNNNKILILGSSGYIGSELIDALDLMGIKYAGLSRSANKKSTYNIDLLKCNVNDLVDIFSSFHSVIGLSWYVNHSDYKISKLNIKWADTYINKILPALLESKVNHFIGVGSCLEYGECIEGPIDKSQKLIPDTQYGISKLKVFQEFTSFEDMLCISWLRLFYVYGGNENPNKLIPTIYNHAKKNIPFFFKNPDIVNDYVHVEHVVKCIISILQTRSMGVFNIGSGRPVRNYDLYNLISKKLKIPELNGKYSGHYCSDIYMKDNLDFIRTHVDKKND